MFGLWRSSLTTRGLRAHARAHKQALLLVLESARGLGSIPRAVAIAFPPDRYSVQVWRHKTLGFIYEPHENNMADANRVWYSPAGEVVHWQSGNPWKKPTSAETKKSRHTSRAFFRVGERTIKFQHLSHPNNNE